MPRPDDDPVVALPLDPEGEAAEATVMAMTEEEFQAYMQEGGDVGGV